LKIIFALKQFFKDKKANARQVNHFLLDTAIVQVTLTFDDSTKKTLPDLSKNKDGKFILDLDKDKVPDFVDGSGTTHKKLITKLKIDFSVDITFEATFFELLRIVQEFSMTPLATNSDTVIDYQLSPFSWKHSSTSAIRTANANVHPLLDLRNLAKNEVGINALVVDLTDLWDHLHKKNRKYRIYKELTEPTKVTFKVFAHLGGNAFIWYSIVPAYLTDGGTISAHVFYSPSDYAEKQNIADEKKYLFNNAEQFDATEDSKDAHNGETLLMGYLLPPVDDVKITTLNPTRFTKASFIQWVTENRRNVVNFEADKKKVISPLHWNIGAGFERAFYGLGKVKPQQILLMPQVVGTKGAVKGLESDPHLKNVTDAIFDLLQSNTDLIASKKDEVITKDKMILSCYSESGWDLWASSENNSDNIKAIIGIEPNSTNPAGQKIIPVLLGKKVQVFIIGRHQGFDDHYRPKISESLQKKIRFLPDEPRKILKYPPDPDSNDFVKFRVARVESETLDPLMLPGEKTILQDLAKRKKPITGKAAIPFIFQEINNSDDLSNAELTNIFYNDNFALTGGQDMTLADPNDFYNKAVTYRTFFQQAVEEIG